MNTLLAVAIVIFSGLVISRLVNLIHLPNVTAFLLGGLLIGPSVLGLIPADMLASFDIITEVALGFIAYSIGSEFKLSYLKRIGAKPLTITLFEGMGAVILVDIVLIGLSLLGVPGFDLPMCITLGAIAAATAPAATLMVIRQYKAKGPVSEMLLPVVAMDDALGLIAFAISISLAQSIASGVSMTVYSMLIAPLLEIIFSIVLGIGMGLVLSYIAKFFKSRGNKLALAIAFVLTALALCDMWNLSNLLCIMMIGAVMTNLCNCANVIIEQTDRFTPPIFLMFFVISGAELNLSVLPTVGLIGLCYVVVRVLGKWSGAYIGSRIVHAHPNVQKYLGFTLIPQAGVAIGMAQMALTKLPAHGQQIQTIVLAGTLIYELIGPVVTKIALTKAGEIKPAASAARSVKTAVTHS
ncbi:MAG: cation:proton antiporter [Clostridiales bacterium]|nr:cation:proton antiporter [Clostridiales bacterium]